MSPRNVLELFLTAASMLLWGFSCARPFWGAAMSIGYVALKFSPWRIAPTQKSISRSNDATLAILALTAIWIYLQRQTLPDSFAMHLLNLCPAALYPKLAFNAVKDPSATIHGDNAIDGVSLAYKSIESQFPRGRGHLDKRTFVDFEAAYLTICAFLACLGMPNAISIGFAVLAFATWAASRNWRADAIKTKAASGLALFAAATFLGSYIGAAGLDVAQGAAEQYLGSVLNRKQEGQRSGNTADTSIGRKGTLDLGAQLALRVDWPRVDGGYLRDGLYSVTSSGSSWFAAPPGGWRSYPLLRPNAENAFVLPNAPSSAEALGRAKISLPSKKERSALPLPMGSSEIYGLPVDSLSLNAMKTPSIDSTAGMLRYSVSFDQRGDAQEPPLSFDLEMPEHLAAPLDEFLEKAGLGQSRSLEGQDPEKAAAAIKNAFQEGWKYTLNLEGSDGKPRTLTRFLRSDRQGHCEYFAASSVLALRRLGIPARYATGYYVHEFDERERLYWVRKRDAHAWAHYWNGTKWMLLDATPGGPPVDEAHSLASDLADRFLYWMDEFDFSSAAKALESEYSAAIAALIAMAIAWRLRLRRRGSEALPQDHENAQLIESMAQICQQERKPNETSCQYIQRCSLHFESSELLDKHAIDRQRALFEPHGDAKARMEALARTEKAARELRKKLKQVKK